MNMLKRELHTPLTEEEAQSLTEDEKVWLRSWNRESEIPGEGSDSDVVADSLYPNGVESAPGMGADDEDEAGKYDDLSNAELKELLAERELPTSGNKSELIERLEADDEEDDDEDEDDEEDDA